MILFMEGSMSGSVILILTTIISLVIVGGALIVDAYSTSPES